ncbi:hypothetical protein ACFWM0_14910 [Streptomyces sp. NPDC058405]|uniref:hypothetical protein n=1 Tax=Streptomyces sp. NPDC058405 TaxID=3346482 RepID=UPI003650008D
MPEPRHTADTITDDELDRLYARLAELEQAGTSWPGDRRTCCTARIGHLPTCRTNQTDGLRE